MGLNDMNIYGNRGQIVYYPLGDWNTASSRLRVYLINEALIHQHYRTYLNTWFGGSVLPDVVVIQKRFDLDLIRYWKRQGIRVIFDCDDLMNNIPFDEVDIVTTDTNYKRQHWKKDNVVVIPDALDVKDDFPQKSAHAEHLQKVVWVGNAENQYHIRHAATACATLGLELTVITDLTNKNYAYIDGVQGLQWNVNTVDEEMIKHDLFIAPYVFDGAWSKEWVNSKSANRILKAWVLGLPVAATPIPSYRDVGLRYCAETVDEWLEVLKQLDDPVKRYSDAALGAITAQQFRAANVAKQWLEVFK